MPSDSGIRKLARALVPEGVRRSLRRTAREAPARLRDLPKDAIGFFHSRAFGGPLPPPSLRSRVGNASRREFETVGQAGSADVLRVFALARDPNREYPRWLDFGCGCGRIARHVAGALPVARLSGVDVDAAQIRWARRHLAGDFSTMNTAPPLPLEPQSFDVVYAISIFTHLSEEEQHAWLAEIHRVLRPGGLLIATTHAPELAPTCPGLTADDFRQLDGLGFLAVDRGGNFNERSTFHSAAYLARAWSPLFAARLHEPRGFVSYQDLSVWEKRA